MHVTARRRAAPDGVRDGRHGSSAPVPLLRGWGLTEARASQRYVESTSSACPSSASFEDEVVRIGLSTLDLMSIESEFANRPQLALPEEGTSVT